MSSDKILIKNIRADIIIGINPEEKILKQPVAVNIVLNTDCSRAGMSDNIEDAVDYSVIHDDIVAHLHSTQYGLLESLAESLAKICLQDSRVTECTVSIDKPQALEFAENVAVEITRSNE